MMKKKHLIPALVLCGTISSAAALDIRDADQISHKIVMKQSNKKCKAKKCDKETECSHSRTVRQVYYQTIRESWEDRGSPFVDKPLSAKDNDGNVTEFSAFSYPDIKRKDRKTGRVAAKQAIKELHIK